MELTHLLLLAPWLPAAAAETVLGAYIFHRHGDRSDKEHQPTSLSPLGAQQVFQSGTWYRNNYVKANASNAIHGMAVDIPVAAQVPVSSPSDSVLQTSAQFFTQGLYPPAGSAAGQLLANGTTFEAPLGGYQFVPVSVISTAASSGGSENNAWLQGSSGCGNAVVSSNNYFTSTEYLAALDSTKSFYQNLLPVYNGSFTSNTANYKNAYGIFDLIHVATIHNQSISQFKDLLTDDTLHQLQTRADAHEWGLAYNASEPIRAISGSILAAQIIQSLNQTLMTPLGHSSGPKLTVQFGAYGAFMSFFGLAQAPAASPNFYGIVDYASSFVIELVTNASLPTSADAVVSPKDVSVRFLFTNGTASDANRPAPYALFGQSETTVPWSTFTQEMGKFAIGDTADWCKACGNSTGVCANQGTSTDGSGSGSDSTATAAGSSSGGVSTPVAGVIGALVTLVVILGVEALVMAIAGLRLVKKRSQSTVVQETHHGK